MSLAELYACLPANKRATCKFDTILNKTIMKMLVIKYPAFEVVVIVPDQVVAHPLCTHFRGLIRSIAKNSSIHMNGRWCLGECGQKPNVYCVKCRIVSTPPKDSFPVSFIQVEKKRRNKPTWNWSDKKERYVKISFVHIILFQMVNSQVSRLLNVYEIRYS